MNPFNVSISRETVFPNAVHNQRRPEMVWQTGQTISAMLESIEDGTATLRAEGDVLFTARAEDIQGQVGDSLAFSVRRTRQGYELTQVIDSPATAPPRGKATSMDAIKDFSQTMESIKENNELRAEYRQEQAQKVARAIAAIRRSQGFMANTGGKSAVAAIVESGLDLSKVSFAMMDRIMHHVDRQPTELTPGDERFLRRENGAAMVAALHRQGLPVSQRNISHMERAWERLPAKVSEPAIQYLVTEKTELTLDNVYKSNYAAPEGKAQHTGEIPSPQWEPPRAAMEGLFAQENISETRENFLAARFLLARDLPITKENIERVLFLQALPEKLSDESFREVFFGRVAEYIGQDRPAGSLSLPEAVHLAEVQLRMATQAAARHEGLEINTDAMKENLQKLTLQEAELYIKMVGNTEADATDYRPALSPASRLVDLFDTLTGLRPLTANVHANIIQGESPFTISGVHESVLTAKANAGYEQNATVPNPRYGDAFSQVKTQFAPLLESMDITATAEHVKAAFILSKNKMDVTAENLHAVKEIEAKITAIANKLHPLIAANMIKEGLNPLEMHADQMLAYIKQFNYSMGESGTEKIARYIREMDENRTIDGDTRKTMIAIYRMLHVIQKDGAAALGLAAQMNAPLTLGGLMNLAQNRNSRKGVDVTVNDALGELERLTRPEGNIRQAIALGTAKHAHMDVVADNFTDMAQPIALEKLVKAAGGMAEALEDLAANAEKPPTPSDPAAVAKHIEAFIQANPEIIQKMQSRNISTRPGHIKAAEDFENDDRALEDALEEITKETTDTTALFEAIPPSDLSPLQEGQSPGMVLAQIRAALGEDMSDPVQALLSVTHGLNGDAETGFQIPVRINGRICHLNMYVVNDRALTAEGAKIFLSLDTARLGTVTAYFSLSKENGLDAVISAQSPAALEALEAREENLLALAGEAGVKISGLTFLHGATP
ncbi:MAG: flagellar hook-length control protein FliK [Defluviitaleaceae bacterium]|nr:flagellar hook-length control protein FliK [Defluviitaleaceae bacterium]MCL2239142.1 flagellar hook-length control protein FliK [Defluviitaleaceae bacterium]